jgi:hypothetical protein
MSNMQETCICGMDEYPTQCVLGAVTLLSSEWAPLIEAAAILRSIKVRYS